MCLTFTFLWGPQKFGSLLCMFSWRNVFKVQSGLPEMFYCAQKPWCQGQRCALSSFILLWNRWLRWSKPLLRVFVVYFSCSGWRGGYKGGILFWLPRVAKIILEHCIKEHLSLKKFICKPWVITTFTKNREIIWRLGYPPKTILPVPNADTHSKTDPALLFLPLFMFSGPWSSQSWWKHLCPGYQQWFGSYWTGDR